MLKWFTRKSPVDLSNAFATMDYIHKFVLQRMQKDNYKELLASGNIDEAVFHVTQGLPKPLRNFNITRNYIKALYEAHKHVLQ